MFTVKRRVKPIATIKTTSQVEKLRKLIVKSLDDDKASEIVTINLAGKSSLADYMIVATGLSQKHISALADHLADKLEEKGYGRVGIEGKDTSDWIVVDAGDIIIQLFRQETRGLYNLEKMWALPADTMEAAL